MGLNAAAHVFVGHSGDYYLVSDGLPQRTDGDHGVAIPTE